MQKFKTVTRTIEEQVVDSTICNLCGEKIESIHGYAPECVEIRITWGFYSSKDTTEQTADICEPCWDDLCSKMKVPVTSSTLHERSLYAPFLDEEEEFLPDCTTHEHQPYCRHWKEQQLAPGDNKDLP